MQLVAQYGWWLLAMVALVCCSAFFSCSEAALFYLRRQDRLAFRAGSAPQRIAVGLLDDPERLLTGVLFWNLVVNITYFAIASIVGLQLQARGRPAEAGAVAAGALLVLIFCSEMLPKTLAVLYTRSLASLVSIPLAAALRAFDPLAPTIGVLHRAIRRLFWPRFVAEPYLELTDLERAIHLSDADAQLLEQEQAALRNIVALSDLRADELMRPRTQFVTFRPPVSRAVLRQAMPPSGYVLLSDPESDEVTGAVPLKFLSEVPEKLLAHHGSEVIYVPWCSTAATLLEEMRRGDLQVAAVVNELGETIGIVTFEDLLASIFADRPSRTARLFDELPIREVQPGVWQVAGMTSLRHLARHFDVRLPVGKSVTVAGVLQEALGRLPTAEDEGVWGPFRWKVVDAARRDRLYVELRWAIGREGER